MRLFFRGIDLISIWIIISLLYCIELFLYLIKIGNIASSFVINMLISITTILFFLGIFGINLDNRRNPAQIFPLPVPDAA